MNSESIIFFLLAAFIAVFSVLTVTSKRIMRSATYLLFVLFGVAGLYFLMGYTFLGSVQVMVYAGGIVVLYVFAILLTRGTEDKGASKLPMGKIVASLVSCVAGGAIILFILLTHNFSAAIQSSPSEINIKTIGTAMLSSDKFGYVLPFEAVSVLLLACIIGGLLIARKR